MLLPVPVGLYLFVIHLDTITKIEMHSLASGILLNQ